MGIDIFCDPVYVYDVDIVTKVLGINPNIGWPLAKTDGEQSDVDWTSGRAEVQLYKQPSTT